MQNLTYDYVIIGAGPVGLYAANKIRKTKKTYVVLEKEKKCGGQPTFLYPEKIVTNFPTAKKILGDKIAKKIIGSNKLNIVYKTTVESIKKNKNNQYKIICNKKTFTAANVIICFGLGKFQHISLDLFNKNPKVTYEVKKIKQFKNKNVIILGGGDSANDYAKQIKDVAASTTLIYHNEKLKNENKKIDGIKYFLGWNVFGTPYDGSLEIEDNVVKTHLVLPYDYIIVQYGYKIINTPSFNKKIKILNNKIVVNKKQETSMKNIYACGDCCHYDKKTYTIKDGFDEVDKILKI